MLFANESSSIEIKDDVMIGAGVHIYTDNHKFDRVDIPIINQAHHQFKNVVIEEGAWIGACSIILTGVVIGKNSVIGAGSIVTKDVPAYSVAIGSPARIIRNLKDDNAK